MDQFFTWIYLIIEYKGLSLLFCKHGNWWWYSDDSNLEKEVCLQNIAVGNCCPTIIKAAILKHMWELCKILYSACISVPIEAKVQQCCYYKLVWHQSMAYLTSLYQLEN